jgi:hypothetical protein
MLFKKIYLVVLILLASFKLFSQTGYIGQTKTYIINYKSNCYITENNDEYLFLNCDGLTYYFQFDSIGLCSKCAIELQRKHAYENIFLFEDLGYELIGFDKSPAIIAKDEIDKIDVWQSGIRFENKEIIMVLSKSDLSGHSDTELVVWWSIRK